MLPQLNLSLAELGRRLAPNEWSTAGMSERKSARPHPPVRSTSHKSTTIAAGIEGLVGGFSRLGVEEHTDATGKRKVDGSLAATRLGQTTTQRWANERFRQTMLLVLEFRREWPGNSLLTPDDVEAIRTAIDNALAFATTSGHVGDIYDTNPTCWAIWLIQRAYTLKAGDWTAESAEVQQRLSFQYLYEWVQAQHSRRQRHDLVDPGTKKVEGGSFNASALHNGTAGRDLDASPSHHYNATEALATWLQFLESEAPTAHNLDPLNMDEGVEEDGTGHTDLLGD